MRAKYFLTLFVLLFLPLTTLASIRISEVMYDASGSDAGHEWIEITNTGDSLIDLSAYKVFEGGVNHKMTVVQGSATLPPHTAAVIADNPQKFLSDWAGFTGTLFDSTFTSGLSNTGETLVIRRGDLTNEDTLTYSSSQGASGNGLSLARGSNGAFVATKPTPGVYEENPVAPAPTPQRAAETAAPAGQLQTEVPQARSATVKKESPSAAVALAHESGLGEAQEEEQRPSYLLWVLGVVGPCIMGAGAVVALQMWGKPSDNGVKEKTDIQKEADSYEIIE